MMQKRKARNIKGVNLKLFTEREDIAWALEVHVPTSISTPEGLNARTVKGIIMTGWHEDSPDSVWFTRDDPADDINTFYTLVVGSEGKK